MNCSIYYEGNDVPKSYIKGYIYKDTTNATSRVEVWAHLSSWEEMRLYRKTYQPRNIIVTWNVTTATALPTNATTTITPTAASWVGNSATATKLATARTISLTGSVTGSGTFDGSGNLTISTTTNHTHSYLPLSGGTLTGAVTFANNTWNTVGDDVAIGDVNAGGTLGVKGLNGTPKIRLFNSDGTTYGDVITTAGGTMSGRLTASGKISVPTSGSSWISGMVTTNASIALTTQNSQGAYHPVIAGKTYAGHFWNLGTITESVGFYGFKSGRTENMWDWATQWNATTGNMTCSGSITATGGFSGSGASLTNLNAGNISSGTLPVARGGTGATAKGTTLLSNIGITSGTAAPASSGTAGTIYIQYV